MSLSSQHPTVDERARSGRAARQVAQRSANAELGDLRSPDDAVRIVEAQNETRLGFLVPVRRGRMSVSSFTFYRGSAAVMAADLADNPVSGLQVQLGGDAHLSNFGAYGSPERRLVFDANDFDETLRGPFEWDVKRLAASFVIAARHNGLGRKAQRGIANRSVAAYRMAMAVYAEMGVLELHYDRADVADLQRRIQETGGSKAGQRVAKFANRAMTKDSTQALRKLTVESGGRYRIRSTPPVLFPLSKLEQTMEASQLERAAEMAFEGYRASIADHRRALLDRFTPVEAGIKVVGVGSVGTRCLILLMEGKDRSDPFFLQFKEAGRSVLEDYLPASPYGNGGRRVVEGQRLVQAVSDPFLGWTTIDGGPDFYVRQLKDWKGSVEVEGSSKKRLRDYAVVCGVTLARGHARTGDPVALSAYLGKGDSFDRSVTEYASRYADRNEEYFRAFTEQIASGRLEATPDL
ncbi:MAG: DUF2252 domain-containing protein [Actinomycetia bacterium]|nr:DUF2252 domain-containing protein [Actinomycetes bacterium]